ncbi:WhiB family transcriptional regulator [Streptomyces xiamenensis]|uniref:WhiB family transcriptional regulator n=1 Tax=Streptomyces xiamenensis TaxID=408015 RepID=UPI0035DA99AD
MNTNDWELSASCAQSDPDAWFPTTDGDNGSAAIRICRACVVRQECLDAAMAEEAGDGRRNRHGIRGGLYASERLALAQQHTLEQAA